MMQGETRIRFHGVANYEIITPRGAHILVDPFFDLNPASIDSDELERVDLICVSHGAFDHLGDAEAIARRTGAPVVCGGDVQHYLIARGIPEKKTRATVWGIAVEVAGIRVQPVESHHWSQMKMPDGTRITGVPMGFVIYADPQVRFYHYGDTAIFSDLKLVGELFEPTIGCVGITQPVELNAQYDHEAGRMLTGEMSAREGALAAQWLGVDVIFPCHYLNPDCADVQEFEQHLAKAREGGRKSPRSVALKPGEEFVVAGPASEGRVVTAYERREVPTRT